MKTIRMNRKEVYNMLGQYKNAVTEYLNKERVSSVAITNYKKRSFNCLSHLMTYEDITNMVSELGRELFFEEASRLIFTQDGTMNGYNKHINRIEYALDKIKSTADALSLSKKVWGIKVNLYKNTCTLTTIEDLEKEIKLYEYGR